MMVDSVKNSQRKRPKSAWRAVRMTWNLMTPKERSWGVSVALINLVSSLLDTVALLGVIPLVSLVIDRSVMTSNHLIEKLYHFLGEPPYHNLVIIVAIGAIVLMAVSVSVNIATMVIVKRFCINCQNRLAREIITKCIGAPYAWLLNHNSMTLAHHVFNDVLGWSNGGVGRMLAIVGHFSLLIFVLAVVLSSAPLTGLVGVALIGVIAGGAMLLIRPKMQQLSEFHRSAGARSLAVASEFISGVKDVKLSGRESTFVDSYRRQFNIYGSAISTLKVLQAVTPLTLLFLSQVAIIIVALSLWALGKSSGEIAGEMALVLLVTARAVPATTRLAAELGAIWNVIPNIEGIYSVYRELELIEGPVKSPKAEVDAKRFSDWSRIEFQNVSFGYSSDRGAAIHDVTLELTKGKSYGVVGPTGAGKTTLIDIILGLLSPTEGQMSIDGVPFAPEHARAWQAGIGYVPQNPLILDATLVENVALGIRLNEIDIDRASYCLKLANLSDVLETVGLKGQIGERGNKLSGGQRQRVAIARALYDRPSILVFDEATSALDTISERAIQAAVSGLQSTVTTITIAHRLATIECCDEIIVLERGRVVGRGDYRSLLKSSILFRQLAQHADASEGLPILP